MIGPKMLHPLEEIKDGDDAMTLSNLPKSSTTNSRMNGAEKTFELFNQRTRQQIPRSCRSNKIITTFSLGTNSGETHRLATFPGQNQQSMNLEAGNTKPVKQTRQIVIKYCEHQVSGFHLISTLELFIFFPLSGSFDKSKLAPFILNS